VRGSKFFTFLILSVLLIFICRPAKEASFAEESETNQSAVEAPQTASEELMPQAEAAPQEQAAPQAEVAPAQEEILQPTQEKPQEAAESEAGLTETQNVTLDFKDADIRNVLKIISYKAGVNIVPTPEVIGNVSIRLVDVPWERALDVLLKSYGYGSERQGNIILVTKIENMSKIQAEEPLKTEIFNLKFLDAQDAMKILIPMLTRRGRVSILYTRGQKGWKFGSFQIGKKEVSAEKAAREKEEGSRTETISIEKNETGGVVSQKAEFEGSIKSKTLVITDTAASLDRIRNIILPQIDKKPKQVLIEARIMEVNKDKLRDFGIDFGTGTSGAEGSAAPTDINLDSQNRSSIAGRNLGSKLTPSLFAPKELTSAFTGAYPYTAGLELLYKKLTGTQFEVIIHALEEDARTNILSAPKILTLDNQEASISVGFHTPILSSTVTAGTDTTGPTQTQTLDYYQEIGIRLNVVPQVSEEGYINMIIHPSVTSSSSSVTAKNIVGTGDSAITSEVQYPVIDVREAQTQLLMKDGETVVLGGLLKDVKSKEEIGIPFLSKIPFLGPLFKRETYDTGKVDLLIFISARIIKEGEFTPEEIAKLEKGLSPESSEKAVVKNKKKKKN
jgi:type IV pilus assembly protein PilQ